MAIEQVGTPIVINTASGTYSNNITVPANANFAVFFFAGLATTAYDSSFDAGQYSVSIGGNALSHVVRSTISDSEFNNDIACAVIANPPTGTQALSITINNDIYNGNLFAILFYSGVDTDDPIIDSGAADGSNSVTISDLQVSAGSMTVFGACSASTGSLSANGQTQSLKYGPDSKSSTSWIIAGEAAEHTSVLLSGTSTSGGLVAISLNPIILPVKYARYTNLSIANAGGDVTSSNFDVEAGDVILVFWTNNGGNATDVITITNTGTVLTWVNRASIKQNNICPVFAWYAIATVSETISVTVESTGSSEVSGVLHCIVHTGVNQTDPVPSGKVYSGYNATDVLRTITPSRPLYSCLWMVCSDYDETGSFVERASNVIESYESSGIDTILLRPAQQPLLDGNTFSMGETDSAGVVSWVALEVQAADEPVFAAWFTA